MKYSNVSILLVVLPAIKHIINPKTEKLVMNQTAPFSNLS